MKVCAGRSRLSQSPKIFFAVANASSAVMSPTSARIALFGRKCRAWNARRSSRVIEAIVGGVPFSGMPYGWKP